MILHPLTARGGICIKIRVICHIGASCVSLASIFFAKSHARLACSIANVLTTIHRYYQFLVIYTLRRWCFILSHPQPPAVRNSRFAGFSFLQQCARDRAAERGPPLPSITPKEVDCWKAIDFLRFVTGHKQDLCLVKEIV